MTGGGTIGWIPTVHVTNLIRVNVQVVELNFLERAQPGTFADWHQQRQRFHRQRS